MKIAFLTEMNFRAKVPENHPNMRVEFSWMVALDADHYYIRDWALVQHYDYVFIIFPKGGVFLNSEGKTLQSHKNEYSDIFASNIVLDLKKQNNKICSIQEGPTWYFNDLELPDQFNFYNQISECDILFAHNKHDTNWYKGLYPNKQVEVIPSLMIETLCSSIIPIKNDKTMIGGNFSRWYGGFQSFIIADEFNCKKYVQTSHSSRIGEDQIPDLTVLPRLSWIDWITTLSSFKYAVHMMPTVAAGTFALNCAFLGIPCIGNKYVDTQHTCFPSLSFHPEDVYNARLAAKKLYTDPELYNNICELAKYKYKKYYTLDIWKSKIYNILNKNDTTTME